MQLIEASYKAAMTEEGDLSSLMAAGLNALYYSVFKSGIQEQCELLFLEGNSSTFCKVQIRVSHQCIAMEHNGNQCLPETSRQKNVVSNPYASSHIRAKIACAFDY